MDAPPFGLAAIQLQPEDTCRKWLILKG